MGRSSTQLLASKSAFRRALRAWYRRNARVLPWREKPSLYATVVSEFMLQQTQIKTALPYFARWLDALPDFKALAAAPEAMVLKLWEGLGYYSRARNLHRLSRAMVARLEPPRTVAEWMELPGVGPYTAAAISSLAFGVRAACVDGNVVRVLARLTADRTAFRDGSSAAKHFTTLANDLISESDPGNHNQAMMELGATVCLPRNPRCPECPARIHCAGFLTGRPETFPHLVRQKSEQRSVIRVWCQRDGAILLHRTSETSRRLAGQHELPTAENVGLSESAARRGVLLATKKRSITRYQITESIHALPPPRGKLRPGVVWVPLASLDHLTLSGPHRRWVREILAESTCRTA